MCGIAGIFGRNWTAEQLQAMVAAQSHRGPDATGFFLDPHGQAALGHNRLSIIDLSDAGRQPMSDPDGRYVLCFNGEIYNYLELRRELESGWQFRSGSDTEVLIAAYARWGAACLERCIGMFAFLLWDTHTQTLFAARDRFGVKPLNYHLRPDGTLLVASECGALHAAGVPAEANDEAWANYLALGLYDHTDETFWRDIRTLPPGHTLIWQGQRMTLRCWYDLRERVGPEFDARPVEAVMEEYEALLEDSVRLRFRADVPVAINLSGGVDSSTLLAMVQKVQGAENAVKAFTFVTGDDRYDELPWVEKMLERTRHPSVVCRLTPEMVPALAESIQAHQAEPFGGLPTVAYAHVFATARREGVIVLLDGQGMDEQWAGYDYYRTGTLNGTAVQGVRGSPVRPECLEPAFRARARPFTPPTPFPDRLRNLQYRDARYTKIPRALRFNDRISMRASTELREPFLDHRLFELAFRQPADRKIQGSEGKWLLRRMVRHVLARDVVEAPKRPLQTPQREWLSGPLRDWAHARVEAALDYAGGRWLDAAAVRREWAAYQEGGCDNSFFLWQWINLGLWAQAPAWRSRPATQPAAAIS